jgi:vitamin B12 transporter
MKQQFSVKIVSAILCGSALFISNSAFSQKNSSAPITTTPNAMEPVLVTANRTPTLATNVLADYDYIGPEEIQQAAQTSLIDLLQRQRGVQISNGYGAGGSGASVFLRGTSGAQSLVLIDGVRVDSGFSGGPAWESIPLPLIDHIEIIFGPQSSLYGADAIGGVVQIFTKDGDGPAKVSASTGYGTYGTSVSYASIYGSTEGDQKIRYSLGVSQTISTGYNTIASNNPLGMTAMKSGYVQNGITGKLSQEWDKGQVFGFQMLQSRMNSQVPGVNSTDNGGPGCVYPDYICSSTQQLNNFISQTGVYTLFSHNQITDYWKSKLQTSQSNDSGQIWEPANANSTTYNPVTNTKQNIYNWQNDISLGTDLLQLLAERRTQTVSTNQINFYSNNCYNNLICTQDNFSQTRNTNSAAAAYQLKRGDHLGNISIRNDSITGYGPQTTGSISYGYFFTKELRANINYGTGFRAPTFNDLYYPGYGNSRVQPEKSKNTEIGIHYDARTYEARVIAYSNTISNLVQSGPVTDNCPYGCATNIGVARINGVSLGGTAYLGNFSAKGSVDQQNPENVTDGTTLLKRAKTFGNASIEYAYQKFIAGIGGTLSGQRYDYNNATSNYVMGGYSIFDLYSSYEFEKDWTLFARWNNITNKQYQLAYGYNTMGSNIFAGIRYAMK